MDTVHLLYGPSSDSAPVRRRARQVLTEWHTSRNVIDDALLIITELVQNVLQHTSAGGQLHLTRHRDTVRIEVRDTSPRQPRLLSPDTRRVGGRGMLVVAALSRRWGSYIGHGTPPGKTVWAEVALASGA